MENIESKRSIVQLEQLQNDEKQTYLNFFFLAALVLSKMHTKSFIPIKKKKYQMERKFVHEII